MKKTKNYSKGIYQRKNGYNVKVIGKGVSGFNKDTTVMQFTNNKSYGKSYFGMEGKYLKNFMEGYKKRPNKKKPTKTKRK